MLDFLGNAVEFLIFTVVLKMIIGHWMAERIMNFAKLYFNNPEHNERYRVIWDHYQHKALGDGHGASDVLECADGKCTVLKTSLNSQVAHA